MSIAILEIGAQKHRDWNLLCCQPEDLDTWVAGKLAAGKTPRFDSFCSDAGADFCREAMNSRRCIRLFRSPA